MTDKTKIEAINNRIECAQKELDKAKEELVRLKEVKPKRPKVPQDTLVEVWDIDGDRAPRYVVQVLDSGEVMTYANGATSNSHNAARPVWKHFRILENEKKVYEGGGCPVPEGVRIRYGLTDGFVRETTEPELRTWLLPNRDPGRIVWYQILEEEDDG